MRAITRDLIPARVRKPILRIERELNALWALRRSYLDALGVHYGTDKSSHRRVRGHNYTPLYESHLRRRRHRVQTVLEIGVGGTTSLSGYHLLEGGQSLRMWRRYFPNATIVGVDIHPKKVVGRRIRFEQGDQSDPQFLRSVVARHGPFDLVIDDGSHIGSDIHASFKHLWEAVTRGGFYVIEDIGLSYSEQWGGGPPGTSGTAADLVKQLVDSTLHHAPAYDVLPTVGQIHLYNEIVFLQHP